MRRVPVYLAWYFLRIRKHHGELGYFDRRFENVDSKQMLIEVQMVQELYERHLILLPGKKPDRKKAFNPRSYTALPGLVFEVAGEGDRIPYWSAFEIAPLGHYFLRELAVSVLVSAVKTLSVAVIGALVALWLNG